MSEIGPFYRYGSFPARWLQTRRIVEDLERATYVPAEEVERKLASRLHRVLRHAYSTVDYYREVMESVSVDPSADSLDVGTLKKMPVLTKEKVQQEGERLKSSKMPRLRTIRNQTGGSTGDMLFFYQDLNYLTHSAAGEQYLFRRCGYKPGDRQVFLWGSDIDSRRHRGLVGRLFDSARRVKWINTFDLTKESLLSSAEFLSRWKPNFIWGYAASLELLAKVVVSNGISGIHPKAIQSTAEVLTEDSRRLIESTFGCRVFNRYGCREVGHIAIDCDHHRGLHLLTDFNLTEIADESQDPEPGALGRIVVTNLHNQAMPFIRYDTGDLGFLAGERCPCGDPRPLLGGIVGRVCDTIVSPSGKLIHGEFFTHLFYKHPEILQFQVLQESPRQLRIRVVPGDDEVEDSLSRLRQVIQRHGDPGFEIEFEICEKLEAEASGKFRFVQSNVPVSL